MDTSSSASLKSVCLSAQSLLDWVGQRAVHWFSRSAEERVEEFAKLMDSRFEIPGTRLRIGLDPLLNLIPFVGTVVGFFAGCYLVIEARAVGVGKVGQLRMLANILIDFIGGSLPFVGWVFDWFWKANAKNAAIVLKEVSNRQGQGVVTLDRFVKG